ncbi:MAG: hypothetical protein AB1567_05195 [bacterium]
MKSINLVKEQIDLSQIIHFAEKESVLLVTKDGHEFILSLVDNFETEVETLRNSQAFQSFLDMRMKSQVRIPIEEIEREIEEELKKEGKQQPPNPLLNLSGAGFINGE